jgi:hypothetical protein
MMMRSTPASRARRAASSTEPATGDVIVLYHRRVPQAHAMVLRAAHARRIFLQHPQARQRLARVEQDRARIGDRIDVASRQGRHAR